MADRLEDSATPGSQVRDLDTTALLVEPLSSAMRTKLAANGHKLSWRNPTVPDIYLFRRLFEEVDELMLAVKHGDRAEAWREAADIANFAAMIADRTGEA